MKNWKKSKTIIVNLLTLLASAGVFIQSVVADSHPQYSALAVAFFAGVNIALRLVTNTGIE